MNKVVLISITIVCNILPLASQAKEVTLTPSDDTYGRISYDEAYGTNTFIRIKNASTAPSSINTRKGVIEFETNGFDLQYVTNATLTMTIVAFDNPFTTDYWVFGINDLESVENFDEATATYNTFKPPFNEVDDGSNDGVDNTSPILFNSGNPLGVFNVASTNVVGNKCTFTIPIAFIKADTNNRLTFIITRSFEDGTFNSDFASKENLSYDGPQLRLESPARATAILVR